MSSRRGVANTAKITSGYRGLRMTRANGSRMPQQHAGGALTLSRDCEMCIAVQVVCSSVKTEGRGRRFWAHLGVRQPSCFQRPGSKR
jgi:hypothetical protein